MSFRKLSPFALGAAGCVALATIVTGAAAQDGDEPEIHYPFAALDGEQVTGGGSEDGYGDFAAKVKVAEGQICYMLSVGDVEPTAAHIHQGKPGEDGAPVVTLEVTGSKREVCTATDAALLRKIASKPGNYYVNVHTAKFPAGAIRGQLEE